MAARPEDIHRQPSLEELEFGLALRQAGFEGTPTMEEKVQITQMLKRCGSKVTADMLLYWGHVNKPHRGWIRENGTEKSYSICIKPALSHNSPALVLEFVEDPGKPTNLIVRNSQYGIPIPDDRDTVIESPMIEIKADVRGSDRLIIYSRSENNDWVWLIRGDAFPEVGNNKV